MEKNKIEVGEYIRTKIGDIGEVENINNYRPPESKICVDMKLKDLVFISEDMIVKHSKNIIDLIEVGDIVIVKNGLGEEELIFMDNEDKKHIVRTHKVKSIVTKEQFKEMEYRV